MRKLLDHINLRNKLVPTDLIPLKEELESIFKKNLLSAGVLQPGYFNDFHTILNGYRVNGLLSSYMITEEQYTDNDKYYKIPVIDIKKNGEQSNIRIFLSPL